MSEKASSVVPTEQSVRQAWWQLESQGLRLRKLHLRTLFAEDSARGEVFARVGGGLFVDFSKEKLDGESLTALLSLAETCDLSGRRGRLFLSAGDTAIEELDAPGRAQIALRSATGATESHWLRFAEAVRGGVEKGLKGNSFSDVLHIGSGGSARGVRLLVEALGVTKTGEAGAPRIHFLDEAEGSHIAQTLKSLDATRTLVVIASRSMSTPQTLSKAQRAIDWLEQTLDVEIGAHLAVITSDSPVARAKAATLGVMSDRIFTFPKDLCKRNTIWGAPALTAAMALGADSIRAFLEGGAELDKHFQTAAPNSNLPMLLALISVWRRNIMGWPTVALIPYDMRLARLIAYLRQLEMESNGKSIQVSAATCPRPTAPIVWGDVGQVAQQSFFQALHQSTDVMPTDFLLPAAAQAATLADCLAQSQALAFGLSEDEAATLKEKGSGDATRIALSGDRPSTTLVYERTDARNLGRLLALWEHKVFCQAVLWNTNPYDQPGVEYGENLAQAMLSELSDTPLPPHLTTLPRFTADSSTPHLMKILKKHQKSE